MAARNTSLTTTMSPSWITQQSLRLNTHWGLWHQQKGKTLTTRLTSEKKDNEPAEMREDTIGANNSLAHNEEFPNPTKSTTSPHRGQDDSLFNKNKCLIGPLPPVRSPTMTPSSLIPETPQSPTPKQTEAQIATKGTMSLLSTLGWQT